NCFSSMDLDIPFGATICLSTVGNLDPSSYLIPNMLNVFFVLLYSRMADKNKLDNMKKEYTWFMEQSKQDVIILEKHLDDLHILFDKVHVSGATASCPGDISSDESSDDDVVEVQKTVDNDCSTATKEKDEKSPFFRLTLSVPLFSEFCVVLSCVIAKIYCYWCHIFAATIINIFIYHQAAVIGQMGNMEATETGLEWPRDPTFSTEHDKIKEDRFWPYFKGAIGAIDGSHKKWFIFAENIIFNLHDREGQHYMKHISF
ncbi:hypothetical protein ACJX0J_008002, partial [Zea mays]